MRCPSQDWDRYIVAEETVQESVCYETALDAGYTIDEADECEDCGLGCPGCPWRKHELG